MGMKGKMKTKTKNERGPEQSIQRAEISYYRGATLDTSTGIDCRKMPSHVDKSVEMSLAKVRVPR